MGIKHISEIQFHNGTGRVGQMVISLHPDPETKCLLTDTRDYSSFPFRSVVAAKIFAKRRRHGRTLEEHQRAEILQTTRERMKWGIKDLAEKIGVSPRTVEAYFSGVRVVPERLVKIEV